MGTPVERDEVARADADDRGGNASLSDTTRENYRGSANVTLPAEIRTIFRPLRPTLRQSSVPLLLLYSYFASGPVA